MGLYQSQTKKGNLNAAWGKVRSESFECDKQTVDEQGRAFEIELTDRETGKRHCINVYGDEVLELHRVLDAYVKELNV